MSQVRTVLVVAGALVAAGAWPTSTLADFMPGNVYVSDPTILGCGTGQADRIWEVNPSTGQIREFARFEGDDCGLLNGLVFTPDGSRLLATMSGTSRVLAVGGDGNFEVLLDGSDGLGFPQGYNNLAYDADGYLYVGNVAPAQILKFPPSGGPPEVFADGDDGLNGALSLAFAPDGTLYVAKVAEEILRFAPDGTGELFDVELSVTSLIVDSEGSVFTLNGSRGIVWYPNGDASAKETFVSEDFGVGAITRSAGSRHLYVSGVGAVWQVDMDSRQLGVVAQLPDAGELIGVAVFVPEPATVLPVVLLGLLVVLRAGAPAARPALSRAGAAPARRREQSEWCVCDPPGDHRPN